MNNLAPTQEIEGAGLGVLFRLAAYAFIAQGLIFVAMSALVPRNSDFFDAHGNIDWPTFLSDLDAAPAEFLIIKMLMLSLRTLYGVSIVGVAIIWWSRNRTAAALVASFIIVSIPVINISQLMGMALVPLAGQYNDAALADDAVRIVSIETTANTVYVIAEYLDTFVNTVPFVGLLGSLFWLSTSIDGLERIKWILPLLMILPFNKFVDLPGLLQLLPGLLNLVATGAYFFLMGWFMLKLQREGQRAATLEG